MTSSRQGGDDSSGSKAPGHGELVRDAIQAAKEFLAAAGPLAKAARANDPHHRHIDKIYGTIHNIWNSKPKHKRINAMSKRPGELGSDASRAFSKPRLDDDDYFGGDEDQDEDGDDFSSGIQKQFSTSMEDDDVEDDLKENSVANN